MCHCDHERPFSIQRETTIQTARKAHTCIECNASIQPGASYHSFTWGPTYDPERNCMQIDGAAMCPICRQAWGELLSLSPEACLTLGELKSCLQQAYDDGDLDHTHHLYEQFQLKGAHNDELLLLEEAEEDIAEWLEMCLYLDSPHPITEQLPLQF